MTRNRNMPLHADASLVARIDLMLPQTQCRKCGHSGCGPYAHAIAGGSEPINRCPPGGSALISGLAGLLGRDPLPLDPAHGREQARHVAVVDEPRCIGCTLCIQACPVDAIVGAAQQMHTVIVDLCTGCDLCVDPCPVDCIAMVPATGIDAQWTPRRMVAARQRFERRNLRLSREQSERAVRRATRASGGAVKKPPSPAQKRATIRAAVERVRARRAAARRSPP